jgi:3-oxoacyl-[acyl-carrier protein] reductase
MNVFITGASRGIGYQIALHFAKKYAANIIITSRNIDHLTQLRAECESACPNIQIIPFVLDLENIDDHKAEIQNLIKNHFSCIDILINNAGCLINKPFAKFTKQDVEQMFKVNTIGPAGLIECALPFMGTSINRSHVVNISSMGGFQGSTKFNGLSYYSATKASLAILTECLAEEYNSLNISFNCLALGAVQTEMLEEAFPGYKASLSPKQMAEFIVDFAVNGHRYFNGKIIPVSISTP